MNDIAIVQPNNRKQDLLAELEKLRDRIEEGGVTDFAIVLVQNDRKIANAWSKTVDKWRLVGALEATKHQLIGWE